ncbi:MAG: lamin tail domain-containing protein [Pseudomonadota bacterium]
MKLPAFFLVVIALVHWSHESCGQVPRGGVVITELMATNYDSCTDPFNEADDWVELHNTGKKRISLRGMSISSSLQDPTQYTFESTHDSTLLIEPGGYKVVWLDPGTRKNHDGLHASFDLSASGGVVLLYSRKGQLLDSLHYPQLFWNESFGRVQAVPVLGQFLAVATPGRPNSVLSATVRTNLNSPSFSHPSQIYTEPFELELHSTDRKVLHVGRFGNHPGKRGTKVYSEPLRLRGNKVIRVQAIDSAGFSSPIETRTYLRKISHQLPVVAIAVDSWGGWYERRGIETSRGIPLNPLSPA